MSEEAGFLKLEREPRSHICLWDPFIHQFLTVAAFEKLGLRTTDSTNALCTLKKKKCRLEEEADLWEPLERKALLSLLSNKEGPPWPQLKSTYFVCPDDYS